MDLIAEVAGAIARHGILEPGERVLVGVSGGADSVALLYVLRRLGWDVAAAHLDHAARPGSAEDGAWVAALCADWGVPCLVERRPVPPGPGFEERARAARLTFFAETARALGRSTIAVGHHRDDQAETMLFRLARGAGPAGLAGMARRRPLEPGLVLTRPLLDVPRAALRAALAGWGLAWREDPTNGDVAAAARNRLRHVELPALEAVHPGAGLAFAGLAGIVREDEEAWQELSGRVANHVMVVVAPGIGEVDRGAFQALPAAVRRRLLRLLAVRMGASPPGMAGLERALGVAAQGGGADLGDGWRAEADPRWLVLRRPASGPEAVPLSMSGDQPTAPWGWRVKLRKTHTGAAPGPCLVRFAPDALPTDLVWRTADPAGDRIRPWGHDRHRTLQSWLARRGVATHRQEALLVLASGNDVVWVPGFGRGTHAPVAPTGPGGLEMQATARFRV